MTGARPRDGRLRGPLGVLAAAAATAAASLALATPFPASATPYLDDWHPYQTYWAVGWNVAVPVTSMRAGFVDHPGWLGGGFDVRVGVAGRLAVGVNGTWNFFEQSFASLTVDGPDFTFTGPVYRTVSSFTAMATAHYYLTQTAVQPYVGLGVGGAWLGSRQRVVDLTTTSYTSGLAIAPELGVLFSVAPRLGLYLSARYQLNLTTLPGVQNPQWVSGLAGIAYYY